MWRTMFYPKNVPNAERLIRIAVGIVLVAIAVSGHGLFGGLSIFSAAFVVLTGFIGWCPACALLGRKIKRQQPTP